MDNEDWFTEKNFQYTLSENKITIRKYIGSSSIVRVPAEINSYPVICLGKESFSNHLSLKKISIPSSITQIENGALWGCPKLASIDVNPENSSLNSGSSPLCKHCKISNTVKSYFLLIFPHTF